MRRWRVATALSANDIDIRLAEAEAEYERRNLRSRQLFERGARSLPGGNTRTGVNFAPFPLYADRGEGVHLYDVDGHRHVDFVNNATALILGHAHPQVVAALQRQLARGTAFSRPTELEVEMAELLRARMPALEKLRFCSSGTEAVLNVLRAARAFTGRGKTAKFEGAYHGIDEQAMVSYQPPLGPELGPAEQPASVPSSEGLSPSAVEDVVVLPFNDGDACAAIIERHADELAAVIVDPLSTAAGLAVPEDGFLSSLREITERHGILLIFDEIVSFRAGPGGAHTAYGVRPDLVCLGKVIAGGTAGAAFGGRAEVMALFDPSGGGPRIWQSGTYNGNPLSLTAGLATMRLLDDAAYETLKTTTRQIAEGLRTTFAAAGVPATVVAVGSLFRVYFLEELPSNYRQAAADDAAMHGWLFLSLLNRGIYWRNRGICGISLPTAGDHVDQLCTAVGEVVAA